MLRWLLVLSVLGCGRDGAPPSPAPPPSPFESFATTSPRVGEPAPEIALADVDGRPMKLSEATARGPVVLVWGSFS